MVGVLPNSQSHGLQAAAEGVVLQWVVSQLNATTMRFVTCNDHHGWGYVEHTYAPGERPLIRDRYDYTGGVRRSRMRIMKHLGMPGILQWTHDHILYTPGSPHILDSDHKNIVPTVLLLVLRKLHA